VVFAEVNDKRDKKSPIRRRTRLGHKDRLNLLTRFQVGMCPLCQLAPKTHPTPPFDNITSGAKDIGQPHVTHLRLAVAWC
jgi:hypothetical protein